MCRLFAYSGTISDDDFNQALGAFSKLAHDGCVPCGVTPGHLDGWGIHASNKKDEAYFRSIGPITEEGLLGAVANVSGDYAQVISHLRKATVGENMICNTHPFLRSGISFCHNGSVKAFPKTSFTGDRHLREGHTDSETFFLRILDRVVGEVGDAPLDALEKAVAEEVGEIKKLSTWTSVTCLLKTKEGIILNYLWNEKDPEAEPLKLADYYTFYKGTNGKNTILCSEALEVKGYAWEPIKNGSTVILKYQDLGLQK